MFVKEINISGRFERIGLRFLVMQAAYRYQIKGSIYKNSPISYTIIASGQELKVVAFIDFLKSGYIGSRMNQMEISDLSGEQNFQSFDIAN